MCILQITAQGQAQTFTCSEATGVMIFAAYFLFGRACACYKIIDFGKVQLLLAREHGKA